MCRTSYIKFTRIAVLQYGLIGSLIVVALNIIFGYLGYQVVQRKKDEVKMLGVNESSIAKPKVLDTSNYRWKNFRHFKDRLG